MMITEGTPCSFAAKATPWAWLPDENAKMPLARCAALSADIAEKAPRNLKLPVCCKHSDLIKTRRPAISSRKGEDKSGVTRLCPCKRASAARIMSIFML